MKSPDELRTGRLALVPALAMLALLALAGCRSLGPSYQRPALPLPERYSQAAISAGSAGTAAAPAGAPEAWWTLFGDPALDKLEDEALGANQDLAAAAARVEESRALLGLTNADRYPEVNAGAAAARTRLSQKSAQLPPGFPLETTDLRATASFSYELDFWGRYARASEAARADLLATEEGQRNVRLGLTADVATAYLDLLSLDRQLAVARATLGSRGEAVHLTQARFDAGTISELDLAQAKAERAATEATIPAFERQLRQTEDRLGVLLGRTGGRIDRPAAAEAGDAQGGTPTGFAALRLPDVPVGLPSQLLARRPDVIAAEQQLVAANARIGTARAAYFPAIALTAYGGTESPQLSTLFSSGATIWQAALSLVQPIFNAGRTRRQVEAATARQHQALAAYAKSVQSAFADVEDALIARSTGSTEREALSRQVESLDRVLHLAQVRYEAGESGYFEVLDAERTLFAAQLAQTRARRDELAAAVSLFKALGGGWGEERTQP